MAEFRFVPSVYPFKIIFSKPLNSRRASQRCYGQRFLRCAAQVLSTPLLFGELLLRSAPHRIRLCLLRGPLLFGELLLRSAPHRIRLCLLRGPLLFGELFLRSAPICLCLLDPTAFFRDLFRRNAPLFSSLLLPRAPLPIFRCSLRRTAVCRAPKTQFARFV